MQFRFFKKISGEKVLQFKSMASLKFEDVPTVNEESLLDKFRRELDSLKSQGLKVGCVILSVQTLESLSREIVGLKVYGFSTPEYIWGVRILIDSSVPFEEFKFLVEVK